MKESWHSLLPPRRKEMANWNRQLAIVTSFSRLYLIVEQMNLAQLH